MTLPVDSEEADLLPQEKKYSLVKLNLGKPPGEAHEKVREFDDLDDIWHQDTDWEIYIVYDQEGNGYSLDELDEIEG